MRDTDTQMKVIIFHIICLLVLSACPATGQVLHELEETPFNDKVNDHGSAATYFIRTSGNRVLKLLNLRTKTSATFSNIVSETVLTNELLLAYDYKHKHLFRVALDEMRIDTLKQVTDYYWLENRGILVYKDDAEDLKLWDAATNKTKALGQAPYFELSADKDKMVWGTRELLQLYDFATHKVKTWNSKDCGITDPVKKIIWNSKGSTAYVCTSNTSDYKIFKLDNRSCTAVFSGKIKPDHSQTIIDTLFSSVRVLSDRYIALPVKITFPATATPQPEIWLAKTTGTTPAVKRDMETRVQLGIADLKNGTFLNLATAKQNVRFAVSHDGKRVFSYEPGDDSNQFIPDIAVYMYTEDFKDKQKLDTFTGYREMMYNTEAFPFILYLKDKDWILYNYKTHKRKAFTKDSGGVFYKENDQYHLKQYDVVLQKMAIYGNRWLFFYDLNDIWIYDVPHNNYKKITHGSGQSRIYRFYDPHFEVKDRPFSFDYDRRLKDEKHHIVHWNTEDYTEEGLSLLNDAFELKELVQDKAHYSQMCLSKGAVSYIKEKANTPPALYVYDIATGKETLIHQGDTADEQAKNLKTEYVQWINEDGNRQGVIVRYPLNYDPKQLYPAVVYIYEDKAKEQNHYQSPFKPSEIGFNHRTYTDNGYFVLEPDIYYEYGAPGKSATRCVLMALDKALEKCSIDPGKVGLTGHSFGGYETNYIITQTNRFKAAVSGAGISDIINWYFSVNSINLRSESWRFPEQSFRMKKSFFDLTDQYLENSPVLQSSHITTPLLLWSGKKDDTVEPRQSVALFLALKNQQKEVNMLLYEKEGHVLNRIENKMDLQQKIFSWFNHYLKEAPEPEWIKEGLP